MISWNDTFLYYKTKLNFLVLNNFTKCFSGTRVNQIVNKCLNGELSRFSNLLFWLRKKIMFAKLLLDKEMDDGGNR